MMLFKPLLPLAAGTLVSVALILGMRGLTVPPKPVATTFDGDAHEATVVFLDRVEIENEWPVMCACSCTRSTFWKPNHHDRLPELNWAWTQPTPLSDDEFKTLIHCEGNQPCWDA